VGKSIQTKSASIRSDTAQFSHITAAILAGGLGTRLRSVVADRPKVLAEVRGRPFLSFLLDQLSTAGLHSVVLCTGYRGEQICQAIGDRYRDLRLSYSREMRPLGTAGALRLALPCLPSDPVLVMNGDSFCSADLAAFWNFHCCRRAEASILLTRVSRAQRYGGVDVDNNDAVIEFAEKRADGGAGWINAGIYLLSRQVLLSIPEDQPVSLEYDVFPSLVGRGLYGCKSGGRFLDIGIPDDFASAADFFANAE
jgi:D-glycero-alpha-D-manno-heptose 1-phosphate guanylyltransferase